ncbi:hypothetical protein [Azospirillum sp.]|uniref:hypothetical protein n=1 Tax=Azospirillum sp. TaxID=34012 RepID=UPI003D72F841
MRTLSLALLALPLLAMPLAAKPAAAENLACQTVNGHTTCVEGSGSLSCQTVNGRTTCSHSPNQRVVCDTRKGQNACPSMPALNDDVVVDTSNGRVRVRTGGVTVDLDDDE